MLLTGRYGLSVHVPVYTTSGCIRHNMSHNAFAYYSAESVFVIEERKTCSHGMARHGARIRAAYMCAPSINITGGHSNQDPRCTQKPICTPIFTHHIRSWLLCIPVIGVLQQMIQKTSRENPRTGRHVKDVFIAYIPDTYVYRIRWKVDLSLVPGIILYCW